MVLGHAKNRLALFCGAFLFLAVFITARSVHPQIFTELSIKAGGNIKLVLIDDLDGDGSMEIAAVWTRGAYPLIDKFLCVYKVKKNGKDRGFLEIFSFKLDPGAVFLDTGFSRGKKKKSFFVLDSEGVLRIDLNDGSHLQMRVVSADTILGDGESGNMAHFDFVRDFDGDGVDDVMVPKKRGIGLWKEDEKGGFYRSSFLNVGPRYYYRSNYGDLPFEVKHGFRGSYWMPAVLSIDYNGDGFRDLGFLWMDELEIFYGGKKGGFSDDNCGKISLDGISEEERFGGLTYVVYSFEDIDGNGLPDIIKNKFKGSFTSMESQTELTLRKDPDSKDGEVFRFLPASGIGQGGLVWDIDGDGKKDLIMVSSSFGIFAIIKALLKRKIDIRFDFHLFKEDGKFDLKSDFKRTLTYSFNLTNTEVEGIFPDLAGDYNGDGKNDVMYATDSDEIKIILNEGKRHYSVHRVDRFPVETSKKYLVGDLDADGKSDIVFYYPKGGSSDTIRLLLSNY